MMSRYLTFAIVAAFLTSCTSTMQQPANSLLPPVSTNAAPVGRAQSGALVVRVTLPRDLLQPHYISPSTKAIKVDITGPVNVRTTAGLALRAKGCKSALMTLQCTLVVPDLKACPSKKRCYTASVATYDAFSGGKIPPGAHELSADEKFGFTIGTGNTTIPLVLQGIPTSITFIPAGNSALTGNEASGFTFPKCTGTPQTVTIVGLDADGNYILGVGAPKIALASGNPAQLGVARTGLNAFSLVPPASPNYAYGNYKDALTATAKPAKSSGAQAINSTVNVTYSGDICGVFTEFPVPTINADPIGISSGPDGNLWFTECVAGKIGKISPAGAITEYPVSFGASPTGIIAGPDGNLWFTEPGLNQIGRITTLGTVAQFPVVSSAADPFGITAGPDGNVWFTEESADKIGKITSSGAVTEYAVPTSGSDPAGITLGANGKLWFAEDVGNKIGEISTSGVANDFSIPTTSVLAYSITAGADGALWFTESAGNAIGRITTSGTFTSQFPSPESGSDPLGIALGPDGAIWYVENSGNRIGRLPETGTIQEFTIPTSASGPQQLVAGPDGALWFTEQSGNKIGRLR
jgi:streptogramin lyase